MGHYDECRDGYCSKCGAAPGNFYLGICGICHPESREFMREKIKEPIKNRKSKTSMHKILANYIAEAKEDNEFAIVRAEMEAFIKARDTEITDCDDEVWYKKGKRFSWSDFPIEEK